MRYQSTRGQAPELGFDDVLLTGLARDGGLYLPVSWPQRSADDWRAMGFDAHSVVADPLFVDPKNDDFRLKPDSPALKLGFHPIDQSKIGPRERPKHSPK